MLLIGFPAGCALRCRNATQHRKAVNLTYAARPEPAHQKNATPGSAWTRECRMLARYRELLYHPDQDTEALMHAVWGPAITDRQKWGHKGADGYVDRLDYNLPDLLQRLKWDEQPEAEVLLNEGNLVGCIKWVLGKERTLLQRENDPRLSLNDDGNAKAAGMGKLSREAYGRPQPLGEPLVLTPLEVPTRKPGPLRASHRRVARRSIGRLAGQLCFWPVGV